MRKWLSKDLADRNRIRDINQTVPYVKNSTKT